MWMTVGEVAGSPAAVLLGYWLGTTARRHGVSPWVAYGLAQIPGAIIALLAAVCFGHEVRIWPNALVWLAWTGFGVFHGWREPRRKPMVETLGLSGRTRNSA